MVKLFLKVVFIVAIVVSAGCGPDYSKAPPEPTDIPPTSEWPQNWPSKVCSPVEHKIFAHNQSFSDRWSDCSIDEKADEVRTRNCIRTTYGLTTSCARCFSQFSACGKDNCMSSCWYSLGRGEGCRKCGWKYCGKSLEKCLGFPRTDLAEYY